VPASPLHAHRVRAVPVTSLWRHGHLRLPEGGTPSDYTVASDKCASPLLATPGSSSLGWLEVMERHLLARCLDTVCTYMAGGLGAQSALSSVVTLAANSATPVELVSVTAPVQGIVKTAAATDDRLTQLDRFQSPVIEAFRSGNPYLVDDTLSEERWPEYSKVCATHDIRSVAALPLRAGPLTFGTMNLFSRHPRAIAPPVLEELSPLVSLAAAVLAHEKTIADAQRSITDMENRLNRREEIEQAKGVLIATMRCSVERATETLIDQSQRENRKLHEVAHSIVRQAAGLPDRR
jgi:GAF domain-containing protein